MAKVKRFEWSQLQGIDQRRGSPVIAHLKQHWPLYLQISLATSAIIFAGPDVALAANSLDVSGNMIYGKIVNIGKWIIIVKGGIDIIQNVTSGDFQTAKKSFLSYLLVYGTLFALPWGMGQVETIFKSM